MSSIWDKIDNATKFLDEKGILDKQVECPKCKSPKVSILENVDGEFVYVKHLTPKGGLCKLSDKPVQEDDSDVIDAEFIDHDS